MEIKSAIFQRSANKLSDCPTEYLPEYAFIGRSNVGKSSLINMLVAKNNWPVPHPRQEKLLV